MLFIFWFKIITHLFKWRNYSSRYTVSAHEKREFSQFLWLYIFPLHKPHTVIYLEVHIIITAVSNKTDLLLTIKFQIFFSLFQSCDCEINPLFITAESAPFLCIQGIVIVLRSWVDAWPPNPNSPPFMWISWTCHYCWNMWITHIPIVNDVHYVTTAKPAVLMADERKSMENWNMQRKTCPSCITKLKFPYSTDFLWNTFQSNWHYILFLVCLYFPGHFLQLNF